MQKLLAAITAAAGIGILSACSSGSQGTVATLPAFKTTINHVNMSLDLSGVVPQYLRNIQVIPDLRVAKGVLPDDLLVADLGTGAVEILENSTWHNDGAVNNGLSGPDGDWVDAKGNLYVANFQGLTIQEYKAGATSPSFTYTSGMTNPIGTTTDNKGNVYEVDYVGGFVNEYKQRSNNVLHTCSLGNGSNPEGAAVDEAGNVFVDYNDSNTQAAEIKEYKKGLNGCKARNLRVRLLGVGGMVLDAKNNLVVCDQTAQAVDVIAPPYSAVTNTLGSSYGDPFHVTINKKNNRAYVADVWNKNVQVLTYPAGTNIATLGSANGLSEPASAVDGHNFVP